MITAHFDYVYNGKGDEFKHAEQVVKLNLKPTNPVEHIFHTNAFRSWFHRQTGQFFEDIRWRLSPDTYELRSESDCIAIFVKDRHGDDYEERTSEIGGAEVTVMIWTWPPDGRNSKKELVVARIGAGKL